MSASVVINGVTLTLISNNDPDQATTLTADGITVDLEPATIAGKEIKPLGRARLFVSQRKSKPSQVALTGVLTSELIACALTVAGVPLKPNVLDRITTGDTKLQRALEAFIACQDADCLSDKLRYLAGQFTRETVALPTVARVRAAAPVRGGFIETVGRYTL